MKDWRTIVGSLFIIMAMVLGALTGIVYALPGAQNAPAAGTAAEDPRLVEAGTGRSWTLEEAQEILTQGTQPAEDVAEMPEGLGAAAVSVPRQASSDLASSDEFSVLSEKEMRDSRVGTFQTDEGTVVITAADQSGTRSHWVGGEIDAGGPYGGPSVFEGVDLTVTVTINDPSIIFLRYDWNNDGKIDFPDQAGAGPDGRWTTLTTFTRRWADNQLGDLRVEGWDGTSRNVFIVKGNNHGTNTQVAAVFYPANVGMKFIPLVDLKVTGLRFFRYVYTYNGFSVRLWRASDRAMLGTCIPTQGTPNLRWYQAPTEPLASCLLSPAVQLTAGVEYYVSAHKFSSGSGTANVGEQSTCSTTNPCFGMALSAVVSTTKIQNLGSWYRWGPRFGGPLDAMPDTLATATYTVKIDFLYEETFTAPDVTSDTAVVEVHNAPPVVYDVRTSPSPALESTPVTMTATFTDPGTDDTWQFQWYIAGVPQGWQPVSKFSYTPVSSARVLLLHTLGNVGTIGGPTLRNNIVSACGSFCTTVDMFDFGPGPGGSNRVPTLAEVASYNVIIISTNYYTANNIGVGNLLADFMDLGGGVIMTSFGFANHNGDLSHIRGRWLSDGYTPIPGSNPYSGSKSMGRVYDPNHPLVQGVNALQILSYAVTSNAVTAGASRIIDYSDGAPLAAVKVNPKAPNGARAIGLPFFAFTPYTSGDFMRLIANAIHYASEIGRPLPQPLSLDPFSGIFPDDYPVTTTPSDDVPAMVEVKDDDYVPESPPAQTFFEDDMESGAGNWVLTGATTMWHMTEYRSYSPTWSWGFNDEATHQYANNRAGYIQMATSVNPGGAPNLRLEFASWQSTEHGSSEGNFFDLRFVEVSTNGGTTWVRLAWSGDNLLGKSYQTWYRYNFDLSAYASSSQLMVRFYFSADISIINEGWYVDDVRIGTPVPPPAVPGLGSAEGVVTVANVPPTVVGGFDSALRTEAQTLTMNGFVIADPALNQNTEWFAYAWDYDDGTPVEWNYKGIMAPPQYRVLVLHSLCYPTTPCPQQQWLQADLDGYDDTGVVDQFDFAIGDGLFNPQPPGGLTAWYAGDLEPGMAILRQYDVIVVATRLAYFGYTQWDDARTAVGDLLAQYLDEGRGGVVTFRYAMELDPDYYQDIWALRGRYITDKYSAVERSNSLSFGGDLFGATKLGEIFEPDHDIFDGVRSGQVDAPFAHGADYPVTIGGSNNAAGVNGVVFADWQDGNTALGVKVLRNGARAAHVGGYPWYCGQLTSCAGVDTDRFMRNLAGWFAGGLPTPKIEKVDHVWADNGVYNVDLMVIDDDMGWTWDFAANRPMEALPGMTSIAHRIIEVAVDNVDPVIAPGSIQAFIAAEVCVRISGTGGNSVTADLYTDGFLSASTTVMRQSGSPNPTDEKCGLLKVDVLSRHTFSATLTYSAPNGGSNPTWLVILPWREPVSPGHGTVTYKYDFGGTGGTVSQPLPTLKQDLLAGGQGAKVDFVAEASDVGTDDLAFFWSWGTVMGSPYEVPNPADAVYTIHVFHNDGLPRTDGALEGPQYLGFTEPYFDVAANTGRSPAGTTDFRVRDTAVHAFDMEQLVYYVVLIVLDDDNTRGYPSTFAPSDGVDMQFVVIDLR